MISFVVPFLDEQGTLEELYRRIAAELPDRPFEVVFVDDGSTDGSARVVERLLAHHPPIRLVQLRGNFGKAAALAAGFDHANGEIVFTMDADLQDDPKEIPRFLRMLDEGYDCVSGYKQVRHDPWHKVLPSRVFNWMVRRLTGVPLHDVNCGFKCYRAEVVKSIRLYGELHRFVPVLAHLKRFRVAEIVVTHHARRLGVSKFGAGRFTRGLMDLLTVWFLLKFDRKPSHFFGRVGGLSLLGGLGVLGYLTMLKLFGEAIGQRPLLVLGVLLVVVGIQILATGLLAELIVSTAAPQAPYLLRRVVSGEAISPARQVLP